MLLCSCSHRVVQSHYYSRATTLYDSHELLHAYFASPRRNPTKVHLNVSNGTDDRQVRSFSSTTILSRTTQCRYCIKPGSILRHSHCVVIDQQSQVFIRTWYSHSYVLMPYCSPILSYCYQSSRHHLSIWPPLTPACKFH